VRALAEVEKQIEKQETRGSSPGKKGKSSSTNRTRPQKWCKNKAHKKNENKNVFIEIKRFTYNDRVHHPTYLLQLSVSKIAHSI
jgi:hypothetical protein